MKRNVGKAFGILLVGALLGVTGCEGGGIAEGQPESTTGGVPLSDMKADMTKAPKMPTGKDAAPKADAPKADAAPTPAEAPKN